jgi:hypothetical protein
VAPFCPKVAKRGLWLSRICLGAFHDMRRHAGKHFASQFHHDAIGISGISGDGRTITISMHWCSVTGIPATFVGVVITKWK